MATSDKRDLPRRFPHQPRFIDARCDQYEAEWLASRQPKIEDYLGDLEGEERVAMWLELVMVDQSLRKDRGEFPTLADYRESCPDRAIFLDLSTDGLGPIGEIGPAVVETSDAGPIAAAIEPDRTVDRPVPADDPAPTAVDPAEQTADVDGLPSTVGPPRHADADAGGLDGLAQARPGTAFGDYILLEKLGAGGMGVVYRALQKGLNRPVALKMIKSGILADERHIRLFRSEAEAVAALDHPNIVPVLDSGEHEGLLYYSMKLVDGRDLGRNPGQYRDDPAAIARLMARVAEAIAHAHERGVLHRDIKPSNVLVDARGEPHVIDFGLARRLDAAAVETTTGNPMGTPGYMSPEQAQGHRDSITTATDVYGLGTLLYALLTGRPPFSGRSAVVIIRQVVDEEPPRPRERNPRVDGDLETICLKCLSKEPKDRYPSVRELADDLNRWLDGRPILARPASRVERAVKWVRRRKLVAALSGAAVIGAILGVAGLAWGWAAAAAARDEFERGEDVARHRAYAATLNLAERDWRDTNLAQVLRDLDETRPPRGKSDLRGFEWYYLDRLCHAHERVLTGQGAFSCLAYSPDGRLLATGGWDHAVTLWDAASGRAIRKLAATSSVLAVAFHPDGKTLASAGQDAVVTVWDAATGQAIHTLRGHTGSAGVLAYSPDGKVLASVSIDNTIKIWDAAGKLLRSIDDASAAIVFGGASTLLSARRDGTTIRAWDVATGALAWTSAGAEDAGPIRSLAITADRKLLASGTRDGTIHLREAATGRIVRILRDHRDPVAIEYLAFSADGKTLASGSLEDPAAMLWEVATGHLARAFRGHTSMTQGLAFSPDGVHLACASSDETVRIWDATRDQESRSIAEDGGAFAVAFGPDGSYLAVGCGDGTVVLHDATTGRAARTFRGHTAPVRSIAIDRDGRRAASCGADRTVRIWEVGTGREIHTLKGHAEEVGSVAFAPGGKLLASASNDRTVKLWDPDAGREVRTLSGHIDRVNDVAFTPDGTTLASAGNDGFILLWDVATGRRGRAIKAQDDGVGTIAISPDGRWIASGSFDRTIKIWDLATGQELRTLLGHSSYVDDVAFSPDGRRLVSTSRDRTIRIWDPAFGLGVLVLRGHAQGVSGAAFSPDGRRLASAGADRTVKLWEIDADPRIGGNPAAR